MKYFTTAATLFAGVAVAHYNVTTETVTAYTTFCPSATTITHGSSTIIATAATTITLACPNGCTVTRPVYSSSSVVCPTSASAAPISSAIGTAPYQNGTITNPVTTVAPTAGSPVATTTPSVPIPSGGANKAMSASGAGLAAALGFAAFFL